MPLEHWMMFSTFAEQDYFIYPHSNTYSGVIINANMAAHAPAGLASFIIGKLDNTTKYIVDPITHAFQHDPIFIKGSKGDVKSSIQTLADAYGTPISSLVGKRCLLSSDLTDANISEFVSNVLNFQYSHLHQYMSKDEDAKYLEDNEIPHPYAVIAPYFYLNETDWNTWLHVNISCVNHAIQTDPNLTNIWVKIVIDKGVLLDEITRNKILDEYQQFRGKISGCILWIDNFDEQEASVTELKSYVVLCAQLKSMFENVVNLHGGYFSTILGGCGNQRLTGVAHGPEFGEFRSVVPVGGGIPIAKYYIPRLHSRIRFREAVDIFSTAGWLNSIDGFLDNICDCDECRNTLNNDISNFIRFGDGEVKTVRRGRGMVRIEFPTSETKIHCLKHYLQRKHREYEMVRASSMDVIANELLDSITKYTPLAGNGGVAHLIRWARALGISGV